jgi:hypothetical protein
MLPRNGRRHGAMVRWSDVEIDTVDETIKVGA